MSQASLEAYQAILPDLSRRNAQALRVIINTGGATCSEIAGLLGIARDSVSPRVGQLKNFGIVHEGGRRKGQTVWVAAKEPRLVEREKKRSFAGKVLGKHFSMGNEFAVVFSVSAEAANALKLDDEVRIEA